MIKRFTAVLVALTIAGGAALAQQQEIVFKKVDFFRMEGEDEKKLDARLTLDPIGRTLAFAHENDGAERELYASIPYENVTGIVYERSKHRRYKAGLIVSPFLFFSSGKKHWLTVEFEGIEEQPAGYVYAQMDKNNYRRILSALEAGTGVDVEEIIEE